MAKLEQGILGPFRGKVGTVVGYLWKGKHVVRAYRREINYPNTVQQQAEREWFVGMVRFAATARQALLLGLRERAAQWQMTEGNAFVKMNKGCFGREGGVDYERIMLSCGPVAPVCGATWRLGSNQVLTVSWERRSRLPRCKSDDSVHLYIYNKCTREGMFAGGVRRGAGMVKVALPDGWLEGQVCCYLLATDAQGHASASAWALRGADGGEMPAYGMTWSTSPKRLASVGEEEEGDACLEAFGLGDVEEVLLEAREWGEVLLGGAPAEGEAAFG